jgi:hypothetical protein
MSEFSVKYRLERGYVDGEGKIGQYYAGRYGEENSVSQKSIISPQNFSANLQSHIEKNGKISAIVVVDDIVATGNSLAANLKTFVNQNQSMLQNLNVPIIALALAATAEGEHKVLSEIKRIPWVDFNLRICDPLSDRDFAFGVNAIWTDAGEHERAKALCTDLGVNIYRDNPLGYGGNGLLIVFPETCPNNSLPILHSSSYPGSGQKWLPLFPRLVN